jgi:hypothetical protein
MKVYNHGRIGDFVMERGQSVSERLSRYIQKFIINWFVQFTYNNDIYSLNM